MSRNFGLKPIPVTESQYRLVCRMILAAFVIVPLILLAVMFARLS